MREEDDDVILLPLAELKDVPPPEDMTRPVDYEFYLTPSFRSRCGWCACPNGEADCPLLLKYIKKDDDEMPVEMTRDVDAKLGQPRDALAG